MYNSNIPSDTEVPSSKKLIKSTIFAAVTAGFLLVTIVMPAEYGIDPTGVGNVLGLKRMGEIKMSLQEEASQDTVLTTQTVAGTTPQVESEATFVNESVVAPAHQPAANIQTNEMNVTLAPDEGAEIKVVMKKGAKVEYLWQTNGGKVNFDVHGDSKDLKINYHNYYKGTEQKREGTLVAEFDGSHGWFWRNRTKKTLSITIKINGDYSSIKRY